MKKKRQQRIAMNKRASLSDLRKQLLAKRQENSFNRKLASTYWDRWRHEVEQRKFLTQRQPQISKIKYGSLFEAPPSHLCDVPGNDNAIGRGSFAKVRKCLYRGMDVAIKEYFQGTDVKMIEHEASLMCKLSHLSIPLFFGVNLSVQPYYIVMQFCGVDGKSITIRQQLVRKIVDMAAKDWGLVCAQIAQVVHYLHENVKCLHNDIKPDNILLSNSSCNMQVVLIDYNKATERSLGKLYKLTDNEKILYRMHYPHLAPEVIDGVMKQTTASDIFAVSKVFSFICDKLEGSTEEETQLFSKLHSLAVQCSSDKSVLRPPAFLLIDNLNDLLSKFKVACKLFLC